MTAGVLFLLYGVVGSVWAFGNPAADRTPTPRADHPAVLLLTTRCVLCHSLDLVLQQRLNKDRWTHVVTKMVQWGAPLSPSEQTVFIEYLAEQYYEAGSP